MDRLPVEMIRCVLTMLDLTSLRNAALSCRFLFNTFKGAEVVITSEIVYQQIGFDVLPEAFLVNISSCLGRLSHSGESEFNIKIHEFFEILRRGRSAPAKWYLADALPLSQLHEKDRFFDQCAIWENEQLACVYDHLVRLIAKHHDVTWGYLEVPYIHKYFSSYAHAIVGSGLEKMYALSQASNYEQWHALLSCGGNPMQVYYSLGRSLRYSDRHAFRSVPLSHMSKLDKDEAIGTPFYDDPDRGPALMWEWIYRDHEARSLVANVDMRNHRQWAFPFWNESRLKDAGLLLNPNIPGRPHPSGEPELGQYTATRRLMFLKETQKDRRKIYQAGGRGWYDYHEHRSQPSRPGQ
ncbi:hypothetical protein CHU98_g1088 [Xylaria longipes]|nr:hypothetical protein CHU98_g1088 [Xylaria longipes]